MLTFDRFIAQMSPLQIFELAGSRKYYNPWEKRICFFVLSSTGPVAIWFAHCRFIQNAFEYSDSSLWTELSVILDFVVEL